MTPAALHMELTRIQLARHAAIGGERVPLIWTMIEPAADDGRSFVVHVRFERGIDVHLALELPAPISLDDATLDALDHAIFAHPSQMWH